MELIPLLARPAQHLWYPHVKHWTERFVALCMLAVAAPFILAAAALVKLSSRGPAFYTQTRMGKDGVPFRILKLRTMVHKCESLTGPRWCVPGDPRITRVGAFLRMTHLDELPQLVNILRGEMSLIGPRPERPEFLPELEKALPGYRQRLHVRPGVTGLAQVQHPADTDIHSVRQKLAYDLYYIRNLSPWLDARVVLATVLYTLGGSYRFLRRLLRFPSATQVERQMRAFVLDRVAARINTSQKKAA